MSSLLYSLGHWAFKARRLVLIGWLIVLVAIGGGAAVFSKGLDNGISIPGTESQAALDSLSTTFPQVSGASAQIIVVAADGQLITDPEYKDALNSVADEMTKLPQIENVTSPFNERINGAISENDKAGLLSVQFDGATSTITPASLSELEAATEQLSKDLPAGSTVSLGGQIYSQSMPTITPTELIGVGIALVVLIITFGSFLAAGMPLLTALLGVGISISLIFVATAFAKVTSTTPMLALMLGLAVGIDYALFIISRHQDELRKGDTPAEAAARANGTAGSAVIFAGLTVMIALLGLGIAGIPFLTTMGVAAAVGVGVSVLISITLIPALLGFAGERLRPKKKKTKKEEAAAHKPNRFFLGWVKAVTRFPIVTILAVIAAITIVALPALNLRLALPDAGSNSLEDRSRITYDLVAENFGEGFNGPLLVTGTIVTSTDPLGLMDDLKSELEKIPGVAAVPLATPNMTADTGIIQVIPEGAPDSPETKALVQAIRDKHDYFQQKYGVDLSVTGFTASGIDISTLLGNALLPFGIVVVGLSLILLTMVFRSIWVPIKAAVGYLFSVVAAFGVVTLVLQEGVGAEFFHVDKPGPVISFMPILVMGILFGLAMDYEVFLVARMREDYVHSGKARKSIITGFVGSAKVVTAAAVIMFAVFAAFVPEGDGSLKAIALALAVGIFVDAFIVRMTFVPAVLQLLGDKAWYIPKWLDRVLPHFDVEGEGVQHELELADWPAEKNVVVAAEGLSLKNAEGTRSYFKNLNFTVPNGTTLFVTGSDKIATSALLLTLSGRLDPDAGKLKVADMVLPVRSGAVRSRVALIDVAEHANRNTVAAIEDASSEKPHVIILDNIDFLSSESERYGVADALNAAREAASKAGRTLTVFVGTTNDMPVETWGNFLSARVDSVVLDLDHASSSSKKVQA
ncbi:RND superfamily putative drug exporter [Aurantimicrobium minutum]|uniref:MMPL family transporter n=1 Tax=Aurantimicrobium minutum TaxID=708131 RepID=UPI0024736164|nr:MMPL family transporter [Aurantimicrobium minutum]MDH6278488.1 RND superfamily putative drug exporter [Aurantimicrobium minutum]